MDRNEILKKAQAGNTGMDEREQQALGVSFGFGAILMCCCASRSPSGGWYAAGTPMTMWPSCFCIWPGRSCTCTGRPGGSPRH